MGDRIDAFASMVAWSHHLLPILDALPEDRRGHLYAPTNLRRDLPDGTRFDLPTMWAGTAPLLVAGAFDLNQSRRPKVFASHGSGQCYEGVTDNPSYDGGAGREFVDLFLTPNQLSADRNLARYPNARAAVIGCPKLDRYLEIPKPRNDRPVVAVAFHWNCSVSPEAGWAWPTWRQPIEQLVAANMVTILGHGHPRARRELEQWYASIGVEAVWNVEELLARSDQLVVDNSCVTPDTLVLCEDLVWRPAGTLDVGDRLIGCDEARTRGVRDRHDRVHQREDRRFRTVTVVNNTRRWLPCCRVSTTHGDLVASLSHPWLARRPVPHTYPCIDKRTGRQYSQTTAHWRWDWVPTSELREGDQVAWFAEPWQLEDDRAAGWLAGMFDGEGCLHVGQPSKQGAKVAALSISQNDGPILDEILRVLGDRKLSLYMQPARGGRGYRCFKVTIQGALAERLAFLGSVRPLRLVEKARAKEMWDGSAVAAQVHKATVASIGDVGYQEVCVLETDRHTFLANGFVAHNSLAYEWAACDRPVIFLDDATWRRDVYHGLRFGDQLPGPRLPFKPPHDALPLVEQLAAAIGFRWEHPDMEAPARRNVTERVYGVVDGRASQRAAAAVLAFENQS